MGQSEVLREVGKLVRVMENIGEAMIPVCGGSRRYCCTSDSGTLARFCEAGYRAVRPCVAQGTCGWLSRRGRRLSLAGRLSDGAGRRLSERKIEPTAADYGRGADGGHAALRPAVRATVQAGDQKTTNDQVRTSGYRCRLRWPFGERMAADSVLRLWA